MLRITQLKLRPGDGRDELETAIRKTLHLKDDEAFSFDVLRQAADARKKPDLWYVYTVSVTLSDEKREKQILKKRKSRNVESADIPVYRYADLKSVEDMSAGPDRPVIIGTGPAGLFCGLLLARAGLRPILIERGDRARNRRKAVQSFWDGGALDPDSNVQFGEGGAGTFSDGKLNTGIRDPEGRIRFILQTFVEAGADPEILYSGRPHVGTDVLAKVVTHITDEISERGGMVLFRTRLQEITELGNGRWRADCICRRQYGDDPKQVLSGRLDGDESDPGFCGTQKSGGSVPDLSEERISFESSHIVLAIGHSARDTFVMLKQKGIRMTPKAFAVGLRVQHPQSLIDRAMYGENCPYRMPPSPYKLTHRLEDGRGVYSFCMCPGGYVVNASSEPGMLALNGMSYHDRASGVANSAIVVTVSPEDIRSYMKEKGHGFGPDSLPGTEDDIAFRQGEDSGRSPEEILTGMEFQRMLEKASYREGGGKIPLQRFEDFRKHERGERLFSFEPKTGGAWRRADLRNILPEAVSSGIEEGILAWDRQIGGFADPEAILAGVESRTSSPVRIERDDSLQAAGKPGLFPCGEGAGYAGGITSAAADGLRIAEAILGYSRPSME